MPRAVQTFVDQYFIPKPETPEQFAADERIRYVSREDLMKAKARLAEKAKNVNVKQMDTAGRFLNMAYDAYVHGAYETTMELYDPDTVSFMLSGHLSQPKRQEFVESVFLKLHEVVIALKITAAVTADAEIFKAAHDAIQIMDESEPWKRS